MNLCMIFPLCFMTYSKKNKDNKNIKTEYK